MAGVVLIPPIHLSARAQEWIVGWLTDKIEFPKSYKSRVGRAACDASQLPHPQLVFPCGAEDVRAVFTNQRFSVRRKFWHVTELVEIIHPTCPTCRVLVDAAIEGRIISFPLKPTPRQTGVPK